MSRPDTVVGQYGGIPYDEYLRKIQQTSYVEDPDQVEKHLRGLLADFRPDAPFLESDQARDPSDRGGGYGSRERLELRASGSRSGLDPYLPDGTFLDHEFLQKDPRGTQNLPNFDDARKQSEYRMRYVKMSKDADPSIVESGINPAKMAKQIRGIQKEFAERYKNFEESMDSWHNGGTTQKGKTSTAALVTTDGTIMDLADATQDQRADPVSQLSNRAPAMLRLSDPDHRVKISKYGMVRASMDLSQNDPKNNLLNSQLDHKVVLREGAMVNRMIGAMILSAEGQRQTAQETAKGADYSDSHVAINRELQKINRAMLEKVLRLQLDSESAAQSANQEFFASRGSRNVARATKSDVRAALDATEINHDIAQSMIQATRQRAEKSKDVRKAIETSARDSGVYRVARVRPRSVEKVTDTLARHAEDLRWIEESKTAKQYAAVKPQQPVNGFETQDYEKYAKQSRETFQRVGAVKKAAVLTTDATEEDTQRQEERRLMGRKRQPNAKKYMMRYQNAENDTDMGRSEDVDIKASLMDMLQDDID